MAKIIATYHDEGKKKEPGCDVHELVDVRKIDRPVPAGIDPLDPMVVPVEGMEYYTRTRDEETGRTMLWAGKARYAGREIPCRDEFTVFSSSDVPSITPRDAEMYKRFACLERMGGKPWATADRSKRRVYFNADVLAPAINIDVEFYNTGNVSSATLDGDHISNSQASRILSGLNAWYDGDDGKIHAKSGIDGDHFNKIVAWIEKKREKTCPGIFP